MSGWLVVVGSGGRPKMGASWLCRDRAGGGTTARFVVSAAVAGVLTGVAPRAAAGGVPRPGTVAVFAGGAGGPGPGPRVALSWPCGMASAGGNLFFTDAIRMAQTGDVVRDLSERTGWMRTAAGIGLPGDSGADGLAGQARLGSVCGLAVDHHGNLVMVSPDFGSSPSFIGVVAARAGAFYGRRMRAGGFYEITGRFTFGQGIAVDYAGNLVITVPGYVNTEGYTEWNAFVEVVAVRSEVFYGRRMQAGRFY